MGKKYAVFIIGQEDETKEYLYADTHRAASAKYRAKHEVQS